MSNVADSNVQFDGTEAFVTTPKVKAKWKATPLAVNYPKFIWEDGGGQGIVGLGLEKGFVTKILDDGGATRSVFGGQVFCGVWSECLIGYWGGLALVTDPYSLADSDQIRVVSHLLTKMQFRHPQGILR
jgi:hypothetical protein